MLLSSNRYIGAESDSPPQRGDLSLQILHAHFLGILLVWLSCGLCFPGQAQSAPSSKQQDTIVIDRQDPTLPEVQQRLDLDRDPIPSPDSETIPRTETATPLPPVLPGTIQKRPDGTYTMHEDVDEVLLNCAVVDERGIMIKDLSQRDFHIWEDGVPQTTRSFIHRDIPVSMGLLIDSSGSMRDKRVAVNLAASDFLTDSNPQDATFIVNFSDHAYLDQGFTSNLGALNQGLARTESKGTTALYDAVAAAADELSNYGKLPRQVLLVITDGADNASRLDLEQAIRRVQYLGGPVVYSIGLLFGSDPQEAKRARADLERLSKETGGIAYFPHSLSEMGGIAAEVARDVRDQYILGYHSTHPAIQGGYRKIHVEVSAPKHGKLIVRTRNGYYAKSSSLLNTKSEQATTK